MGNWNFFKWICPKDKPIELLHVSKEFNFPDAATDRCVMCGTMRENHNKLDHRFKERGE